MSNGPSPQETDRKIDGLELEVNSLKVEIAKLETMLKPIIELDLAVQITQIKADVEPIKKLVNWLIILVGGAVILEIVGLVIK